VVAAFPWDDAPRYLLRDRDRIYGTTFQQRVWNMGIEEVVIAPRSPWQNPYVERLIGSIRVDLSTLRTEIERRDAQMQSNDFLHTEDESNRYATFERKGIELGAGLEPGKEVPAKISGILTINRRPIDITADARITYVQLTPEQLDTQKRFGFTTDNFRVRAQFMTSFTNHGMQVSQLLILKLANAIQIETDLTLVRQ